MLQTYAMLKNSIQNQKLDVCTYVCMYASQSCWKIKRMLEKRTRDQSIKAN